jgi:Derlin-2/3
MLPFALLFFSLITGGDIISDIVGIAAGHLYYYLKDLAPLQQRLDTLKTPQFL